MTDDADDVPEPDPAAEETAEDITENIGEDAAEDVGEPLEESTGFGQLGLRAELLASIAALGYEEPTPIQREAIPPLLQGHDLVGQAATGTGKTAAFALPVLERVARSGGKTQLVALILVPTRELAMQVSEAIYKYGRELRARVLPIYGGQHIGRQLDALSRGVDVVVATPGRALDHIRRGTLRLDAVQVVVLDEADEMLDMGFAEDLEAILDATPHERQTVLFSATIPPRIAGIARRHLHDPVRIQITAAATPAGEAPLVRQSAYIVPRSHKPAALGRILDVEAPAAAIVFCRTRTEVDQLTETLNGRGYRAEALHGGMSQEQRDRVMGRVRNGTAELLVATDVAARGLDIDQLTHVVNYEVPSAPEAYVHRIGRVGRAGREGVAITLTEPREQRLLANIERLTKQQISIEKIPSVADLRARQMELTQATLRERLGASDLDQFAAVVDALAEEFEMRQIALAAVQVAHEAGGATVDEVEIPDLAARAERDQKARAARTAADRGGSGGTGSGSSSAGKDRGPAGATARLYFGVGRATGVRPQDLVGAIANETKLSGRDIGAIRVAERHSVVEVPERAVDEVIAAMGRTTIKGTRPTVRRYREETSAKVHRHRPDRT